MSFSSINKQIHLWLGLTSGLVVFILGVTGCLYAFEKEIRSITEPYQFVEQQNAPFLEPAKLQAIATDTLGGLKTSMLKYASKAKAVTASHYGAGNYWMVYLNPYNGEVLKVKNMNRDFFRIVLTGHYSLWLPVIGQKVAAWGTLIFVVILISGLIMWWPKRWNRSAMRGAFKVNLRAGFAKLNHDLHNVLGFYALLVTLAMALTGLVWGFEWFSKSTYWLTTGGETLPVHEHPKSDTRHIAISNPPLAADAIWQNIQLQYAGKPGDIYFEFPHDSTEAFAVTYNPDEKSYYKMESRFFDQYTGKEVFGSDIYAIPYNQSGFGNKLRRMNYDIHTGSILGLPGRILAFFASLIAASLPVTGVLIWLKKKRWFRREV